MKKCSKKNNTVFLCLGSNCGDKINNLELMTKELEKRLGKIKKKSSVYETEPWGFESEENFINQVVLIETTLTHEQILSETQKIEIELGRKKKSHNNNYYPRTADIDILFYNNEIIQTEKLILPHPRLHLRKFVLTCLYEIDKNLQHPVFNKTIKELLEECFDQCNIIKLN